MLHLRAPRLRSGFGSWVAHTGESQAAQQTLKRMAARWRLHGVHKALNAWFSLVASRFQLRRAAFTLRNLGARRALNSWRGTAATLKPLRRGAARWISPAQGRALNKLRAWTRKSLHVRRDV